MHDSTRRQLARRAAAERGIKEACRRDREIAELGEAIETQLRTRDTTVKRTGQLAGELLSRLTRDYELSMEQALLWCGNAVNRAEALRLRRQYERQASRDP